MTSVQGRRRPRQESLSAAPSVAPFISPPDPSPPPKSGNKLSDQPTGPSGVKLLVNAPPTVTSVSKYSEDDLQRIFKAVLKARAPIPVPAPAPALAPAPIVSELPRKKLKACSPNVYCRKSHIDCYNFCQQCEDDFAIARATGLTQFPFAMSFL